jgi:hypothetical protein
MHDVDAKAEEMANDYKADGAAGSSCTLAVTGAAVSTEQSTQRAPAVTSEGEVGSITWDATQKMWRAELMFDGKLHSLGHYSDEQRAKTVYDEAHAKIAQVQQQLQQQEQEGGIEIDLTSGGTVAHLNPGTDKRAAAELKPEKSSTAKRVKTTCTDASTAAVGNNSTRCGVLAQYPGLGLDARKGGAQPVDAMEVELPKVVRMKPEPGSAILTINRGYEQTGVLDAKMLVDNDGVTVYNAQLVETNVIDGTNRFYHIHCLDTRQCTNWTPQTCQFEVFCHFGRIGQAHEECRHVNFKQYPFSTKAEAIACFKDWFKKKTGNEWADRSSFKQKPKSKQSLVSLYLPLSTSG